MSDFIYHTDEMLPGAELHPETELAIENAILSGFDSVVALIRGVDANARNWGFQDGRRNSQWCGLCNHDMNAHTVMTAPVTKNGREGLQPVGWACPHD